MKALKVIGLFLGSLLCGWASYLVYPTAYHMAWERFLAFVTNESTRQWSGMILLMISGVLLTLAVFSLKSSSPRKRVFAPDGENSFRPERS